MRLIDWCDKVSLSAWDGERFTPMEDVSLSELKAFAAVARHRSFRGAADTLGVSRSSLSHALRALERRLGVRLLHRTTRSVGLTEAGARLLERLSPTLGALDDILADVRSGAGELAGALRVNANEGGARWLIRHVVPDFVLKHPGVRLDLVIEGRLVDIVAEGFDAGVRLAEAVPQDMIAVPFGGAQRFIAVASPAYLAAHGRPATPDDLKHHRCIRQRLPSGKLYRWEFERGQTAAAVEVDGTLGLDHSGLMVEAALEGVGIAFVPETFARAALAEGRLEILLAEWSPPFPGLCLYYAGRRHVPAALGAFIAAVRAAQRTIERSGA
ncbi:LysR family transcriptional regulator [Brevundimonas sp. M20]|uniref:LysR family transcriptional regulator n=1 Tax=Brevundimonas sp. M20 TaxID=2591463 RepID=UPI001F100744|nr:LysR family transcriptional regulator [Brevundimonas sp. M20]